MLLAVNERILKYFNSQCVFIVMSQRRRISQRAISDSDEAEAEIKQQTPLAPTSAEPAPQHHRANESQVWRHFNRATNTCNYCSKRYEFGDSTTHLADHLHSEHGIVVFLGAHRPHVDRPSNSLYASTSQEYQRKLASFLDFLTGNNIGYTVVDNGSCQRFLSEMDPRFQPPSARLLHDSAIPEKYEALKAQVVDASVKALATSTTTDFWTCHTQSFLGVNAKNTTAKGQSEPATWGLIPYNEDHDHESILKAFQMISQEFRPSGDIASLTTDNAANMRAFAEELGLPFVACFAHCLKLLIDAGLAYDEAVKVLLRASRVANFFHRSDKGANTLHKQQAVQGLPVVQLIVRNDTRWASTFHCIDCLIQQKLCIEAALDLLADEVLAVSVDDHTHACAQNPDAFIHPPPIRVQGINDPQDVVPLVDDSTVQQESAALAAPVSSSSDAEDLEVCEPANVAGPPTSSSVAVPSHKGGRKPSSKKQKERAGALRLKPDEWELLKQLRDFLAVFAQLTDYFQRESIHLSDVVVNILVIKKILSEHPADESSMIKEVKARMLAKSENMTHKFSDFLSPTGLHYVCLALDPRTKDHFHIHSETKAFIKTLVAPHKPVSSPAVPAHPKPATHPKPETEKPLTIADRMRATFAPEVVPIESEVDLFFLRPSACDLEESPITWWFEKRKTYPSLFEVAIRYLTMQPTQVPTERLFSASGRVFTKYRARLDPQLVSKLVFIHENDPALKSDRESKRHH